MPRPSIVNITVEFIDGTQESHRAGIHTSETKNMLMLWPEGSRTSIQIPMTSVKKITVGDGGGC